jgi:outer membrane murein-binding lipoprotein Lpp
LLPAVPAAAAGPASGLGLQFAGVYADPTSPTGIAGLAGMLPLDAFASAARVNGISTTVNGLGTTVAGLSTSVNALNSTVGTLTTSFNALSATVGTLGTSLTALGTTVGGLSTQINTLNASVGTLQTQMQAVSVHVGQIQQQLALQDRVLRQGVAMSLAMDGTGALGADETFAISMNLGTYGGQNGMAAGFAFRAAQHVTFNGGIGTGVNGGLVGGRAGVRLAW